MLQNLPDNALVIKVTGVELPSIKSEIIEVDFKAQKIKSDDWALSSLRILAGKNRVITTEMLKAALALRFKGRVLEDALALLAGGEF